MVDWVIGNFSSAERKVVEDAVSRAVDAALCVMERGVAEAQNRSQLRLPAISEQPLGPV